MMPKRDGLYWMGPFDGLGGDPRFGVTFGGLGRAGEEDFGIWKV